MGVKDENVVERQSLPSLFAQEGWKKSFAIP